MIEKMMNEENIGVVVFDIDETLNMFREIKNEKVIRAFTTAKEAKNMEEVLGCWAEWNEELNNDVANEEMVELYKQCVADGYKMVVLSARGVCNIDKTIEWMDRHGLVYDMMLLRPEHMEGVGSGEYKDYMIEKYVGWDNVVLGVDDSGSVLTMFEDKGVKTIKA